MKSYIKVSGHSQNTIYIEWDFSSKRDFSMISKYLHSFVFKEKQIFDDI